MKKKQQSDNYRQEKVENVLSFSDQPRIGQNSRHHVSIGSEIGLHGKNLR